MMFGLSYLDRARVSFYNHVVSFIGLYQSLYTLFNF